MGNVMAQIRKSKAPRLSSPANNLNTAPREQKRQVLTTPPVKLTPLELDALIRQEIRRARARSRPIERAK